MHDDGPRKSPVGDFLACFILTSLELSSLIPRVMTIVLVVVGVVLWADAQLEAWLDARNGFVRRH